MRVTATEAENRFGSLGTHAKREPVLVEKPGPLDTVTLSAQACQALQASHDKASRAARKWASESEFREWIAAQNARVDSQDIPGADLRPW